MTPKLRRSFLVRVYTAPGPDGVPRCSYRVHDLKTGREVEFATWEELQAYLQRRWPGRLR
ncbi:MULTISPECIES: hypothetical protein [unclassified Thermus]|uniref:hypothetical protein n=1 Tax=unclassified Thermus TaxID=2619321 RepID=UPI00059DBA95|nr:MULTISPECIES: hypothetical protein [unclassified Thermus]MDW8356408.1 hypothetical protein [Thermus sp.]